MVCAEVNKLTKTFGKKVVAVNDVSISFNSGEIVGIIGSNGAGKTTIIRSLIGLIKPTNGMVLLMGKDPFEFGEQAREFVGFVSGENCLPANQTVREVLMLSAITKGRGWQNMESLAKKFDLDLTRKVGELSLGNQRKVLIVGALIGSPKLLILDEPVNGLDPVIRKVFYETLEEYKKKGVGIIISSHNLADIQKICDKVAILKDGKLVAFEEMGAIKDKTLKIVSFETDNVMLNLDFAGVSDLKVEGNAYQFNFNGEIKTLIDYLTSINVSNLNIKDASIEEMFLKYYE